MGELDQSKVESLPPAEGVIDSDQPQKELQALDEALSEQFRGNPNTRAINHVLIAGLAARATLDNLSGVDTSPPILGHPLQLCNIALMENMRPDVVGNSHVYSRVFSLLFEHNHPGERMYARLENIIQSKRAIFVDRTEPILDPGMLLEVDRFVRFSSFGVWRHVSDEWFAEGKHIDLGEINQEVAWRYTQLASPVNRPSRNFGRAMDPATTLEDYSLLAADVHQDFGVRRLAAYQRMWGEEKRPPSFGSFRQWMDAEQEWLDERVQFQRSGGLKAMLGFLANVGVGLTERLPVENASVAPQP